MERREGKGGEGRGGKGRGVPPLLSLHFKHWSSLTSLDEAHFQPHRVLLEIFVPFWVICGFLT